MGSAERVAEALAVGAGGLSGSSATGGRIARGGALRGNRGQGHAGGGRGGGHRGRHALVLYGGGAELAIIGQVEQQVATVVDDDIQRVNVLGFDGGGPAVHG